ncbi:MAG: EscU/YscU/HrcU family type III secretion system export apparatus switch protein [Mariprofundaceae bacterium]|nr:EscU/YscU/HrcU family type III secretion system export apparatus switch protein [Mariprofundaceae bacterium]
MKNTSLPPHTGQQAAVAISYDPASNEAPRVLAAGVGEMAKRILSLARDEHIYIHQNATLANLLARVPAGSEIPEAAYQLIAELLAFLYASDERLAAKMSAAKRQHVPPSCTSHD